MKQLLANLYMSKAQTRDLKLFVFGLSLGRGGVVSKDLNQALDDNLQTDIGCVERILS